MSDEKSFQYVKIMLPHFRAVVKFINILNKRGPKTELCGTPFTDFCQKLNFPLTYIVIYKLYIIVIYKF